MSIIMRKRPIDGGWEVIIYHPQKAPLIMRFYVRKRHGIWYSHQCYKGNVYILVHGTQAEAERSRDGCVAEIVKALNPHRKPVIILGI